MSSTDDWIENLEHECEYFNAIPTNIRITFIHLSKSNSITHIKKEKLTLIENGTLKKEELIKLLNLQNNKIVGLFKCNTKILLENIKENKINYSFCNELKSVKDEVWSETTNFLEKINDLIILIKPRHSKQTKKMKPTHNKTRKL
tara:strand:- start:54 stop:488 length:435 start_codon:yes stop_codon:yes gene_type:complete